jgi:hypothetical protein
MLPSFVPAPLRRPQSALRSVAAGWALAFFPALLLSALAQRLLPGAQPPAFEASGALAMFALVVFAPLVETLIMGAFLLVLLRMLPPVAAILASAAGWGIAHSVMAPAWGLVVWWPFLVFSTLFVAWRPRGWWAAVGVAATTHALHNLGPALLVAFA